MTGPELALLVRQSLACADPEEVLDVFDAGYLEPDVVAVDPLAEALVATVVAMITEGTGWWTSGELYRRLLARGLAPIDAAEAITAPGAWEMSGGRVGGLAHWLHRAREEADRKRLGLRLAALADMLDRPGGPDRVAAVIGESAA